MKALVDNDILLKGSCYGLLTPLMEMIPGLGRFGILGAARFIVPKSIERKNLRRDCGLAQARFFSFLSDNDLLEPSFEEQRLAAIFEASAQRLLVNLDAGESQLAAILVSRMVPWLLTGDKRAIFALETLFDTHPMLGMIAGCVRCLEQLVQAALINGDGTDIRAKICAEPEVDKALNICFGCTSSVMDDRAISEGLDSYITYLRNSAPRVLAT